MQRYLYLVFIIFLLNCDNERIVQLPEIENAEITKVSDVSPAYIFYDKTQPDSTLFNRKNLIGTTNWLVNVDKRLTLKQAIPHIQYLQNKRKKASMHKNEEAKNYFTCNDTSIGSLGFVEFTDVNYQIGHKPKHPIKIDKSSSNDFKREFDLTNNISSLSVNIDLEIFNKFKNDFDLFIISLESMLKIFNISEKEEEQAIKKVLLKLYFDKSLKFQDYVSFKMELKKIKSDKIIIDTNEFIY